MSESRWIVIDRWDDFQHYKNRTPAWIKVYTELLNDPHYRELSFFHRGLLHGIWLLYAASRQAVPASPAYLSRRLAVPTEWEARRGESLVSGGRVAGELGVSCGREDDERPVRLRDLKRLEQAGFLRISASKPLARPAQHASPDKRREENPKPPTGKPHQNGTAKAPFECPECGQAYGLNTEQQLAEHLEHVHWITTPPAEASSTLHNKPTREASP